ncbi:ribosome small subunit-dependent GTPase A [Helcococcus kunzii]|uniref:ribosome small subunit-dependent GTPase A n=1 Tax=Helcococcus kunzii TaxID=40091 RepID=UPI0024AE7EB2|nr:ribosome small subunit-dependent GTPase A [Helcococcus kunzii]
MNKKGIITKSQKDLYYVIADEIVYQAKARGLFREKNIKPIVGDKVEINILQDGTAYIENVLERKNSLVRPPIANIDQILLVHSLVNPKINYTTFDKYLIMLEHFGIEVNLIINKIELASESEIQEFKNIYDKTKYRYIFTSAEENIGIDELKAIMKDKISSFAGPSGVGKSTLLNLLHDSFDVETGNISKKTSRGKHTTRHTELFEIDKNTFIFDTPGFSSLDLSFIKDEKLLKQYFDEFLTYQKMCKFNNCDHINEPKCAVKDALEKGEISKSRYDNYIYIYNELKRERKY